MTKPADPEPARGALIILEGCDRAGKSTQCVRLLEYLRKVKRREARLVRFPDRTTVIGSMINDYLSNTHDLDDRAVHLLFSANRWEAMKSMSELLKQGVSLVVDRYAFSGVAFSAAKGLDVEWCKAPDRGLLTPDLVFFLDLNTSDAMSRGGFGNERYETFAFQEAVRKVFHVLRTDEWNVIDAGQAEDQVFDQIRTAVDAKLDRAARSELKMGLWLFTGQEEQRSDEVDPKTRRP